MKRIVILSLLSALLSGCVVYGDGYSRDGYYRHDYYSRNHYGGGYRGTWDHGQ